MLPVLWSYFLHAACSVAIFSACCLLCILCMLTHDHIFCLRTVLWSYFLYSYWSVIIFLHAGCSVIIFLHADCSVITLFVCWLISFLSLVLLTYFLYADWLNKRKQLDLVWKEVNIEKEEFISTNTTLTKAVQNFILSTKRFNEENLTNFALLQLGCQASRVSTINKDMPGIGGQFVALSIPSLPSGLGL